MILWAKPRLSLAKLSTWQSSGAERERETETMPLSFTVGPRSTPSDVLREEPARHVEAPTLRSHSG